MKLILSKIKTYFGKLDKLLLFMCIGIALPYLSSIPFMKTI